MYRGNLGQEAMRDTTTLNEEWLERTKRLTERSVSEADIIKSKSLWNIASKSQSNRLEWLDQTRNAAFLIWKHCD
jgi:hypothetical protein